MEDKQMIDLTEIEQKYKDKCSLIKAGKCKNVNIFIEQSRKLKAKEQEVEDLKIYIESNEQQVKEVETLVMDNDRLINELDQLKVENEHLSEKEEEARHYLEEASKYKQILAEIKKIAETCILGIDCSECPYAEKCRTDIVAEALGVCKLILQKFEGLNDI